MPGTNLWHFVPVSSQRINEGVYIGKGSKTYQKYGIIKLGSLMVRKGNDGVSCLVATFSLKDSEPRMLDLKHFNRAANEFCKCFKSCGSEEAFIEMFDGKMSASDDPNPKRPKLMEVASHAARKRQQENVNDQQAEFNDSGMDKEISPYHQGHFVLPVKCLECPPEEWLVRNCSDTIVKQLKQEMLKNACTDVQPILCIVHLKDGEIFQANMKEGYKYFTIGGNHSRQALQELLSEKEELQNCKHYTHRLCSVYLPMNNTLVRRLASKHNRAASHVHEMTTWDLIQQSRKLLYELSDIPLHQDPPTRKPEGWRKACSAVLAIEVEKLDERLIYYLSSVRNDSFSCLRKIFELHTSGDLKPVSRSKKGVKTKPPDLAGSSFKPFRGLDPDTFHHLLADISSKTLSFKEAVTKCSDIKAIVKVKNCFMKGTGCKTWEEAEEKFPIYTTPEKLEPFKSLNYSGTEIPAQLLQYCNLAKSCPQRDDHSGLLVDHDDVFVLKNSTFTGIMWKTKLCDVNPDKLKDCFQKAGEDVKFPGFVLSFLDFTGMEFDVVSQDSIQALRVLRALNYNEGIQNFRVIVMCDLRILSYLMDCLCGSCEELEMAVCGFSNVNGNDQGQSNKQLICGQFDVVL